MTTHKHEEKKGWGTATVKVTHPLTHPVAHPVKHPHAPEPVKADPKASRLADLATKPGAVQPKADPQSELLSAAEALVVANDHRGTYSGRRSSAVERLRKAVADCQKKKCAD